MKKVIISITRLIGGADLTDFKRYLAVIKLQIFTFICNVFAKIHINMK